MIDRDPIQLVPTHCCEDLPDVPPTTDADVAAALADPATWLPPVGAGPIMVIPADRVADQVFHR